MAVNPGLVAVGKVGGPAVANTIVRSKTPSRGAVFFFLNSPGRTGGQKPGFFTKKLGLKPRPFRTALCYHFNVATSHVKCLSRSSRLKEDQISTSR